VKGLGNRFAWYISQKYSSNTHSTWTCTRLDGNGASLITQMFQTIVNHFQEAKNIVPSKKQSVSIVWNNWSEILTSLNSLHITSDEQKQLETKINEFGNAFKKAFGDTQVTPYIHLLVCHIPWQIKRMNTMQVTSQQKFEAFHRTAKSVFYNCTMRGGCGRSATKETLAELYIQRVIGYDEIDSIAKVKEFQNWMGIQKLLWKSS
jgi:hypothetical protein